MARVLWIAGSVWVTIALVLIAGGVLYAITSHGPGTLLVLVNPFEAPFWITWGGWLAAFSPGLAALGVARWLEKQPPP